VEIIVKDKGLGFLSLLEVTSTGLWRTACGLPPVKEEEGRVLLF